MKVALKLQNYGKSDIMIEIYDESIEYLRVLLESNVSDDVKKNFKQISKMNTETIEVKVVSL